MKKKFEVPSKEWQQIKLMKILNNNNNNLNLFQILINSVMMKKIMRVNLKRLLEANLNSKQSPKY